MRLPALLPLLFLLPGISQADAGSFTTGPAIEDYGPVADVDFTLPIPPDAVFRHSFDVSTRSGDGEPNGTLITAARFINMHARAGVGEEQIKVAIVVHGSAVHDVSGEATGNADLVATLIDHGTRIIVCGQSAAFRGVRAADLLPGVELALSAMTAHSLLQQAGYTLNPF